MTLTTQSTSQPGVICACIKIGDRSERAIKCLKQVRILTNNGRKGQVENGTDSSKGGGMTGRNCSMLSVIELCYIIDKIGGRRQYTNIARVIYCFVRRLM